MDNFMEGVAAAAIVAFGIICTAVVAGIGFGIMIKVIRWFI